MWNAKASFTYAPFSDLVIMVSEAVALAAGIKQAHKHTTQLARWHTRYLRARAHPQHVPLLLLLLQAFDAGGRQPGCFLAEAVVDVAAMLLGGRLNASVQLVSRKGE